MNNNYFYKLASIADRIDWMRKVALFKLAAPESRSILINPGSTTAAPATASSSTAPSSAPNSTGGAFGLEIEDVSDPTSPKFISVDNSVPTNAAMPSSTISTSQNNSVGNTQQDMSTVDQLTDRWVQEKQDFYRNKATKYPQYANWTVNPRTREHLRQQAEDMIKNDSDRAREILATPRYNPKTDVYRDEAFQYANRNNKAYVDERRDARAQEEAAKQNGLMQNPTASSAIQNPRQYDYSIPGAQQFVGDWVRRYGNPASSMQLQSRFSNDFAHAFPGFYQVPPGSTMWLEFSKDMRQRGLDPFGTMGSSIDNGYFDDPDAPAATSFEDMLKWYRKDLAQYGWAHPSTPEGQARIARANRYGRNLYASHPSQSFQEDAYNRGINLYGNMANIVRDAYLDWGDNYILDNLKLN